MNILFAIACICVAGFIHGFNGFGYAMVAMATLPLFIDLSDALFLGAFFTLPVAAITFWRNRNHYIWKEGWTLAAGTVVGTPIGLLLVHHLDKVLLLRLLGLLLIVFPLNELLFHRWWKIQIPAFLGFPTGIACGILGAGFNIGGPPAIVYVYSRGWRREREIATLQVMYFVNSGLRVLLTISTESQSEDLATICALALGPFVLVVIAGNWLGDRVSPLWAKRIVLVALIGMGVNYAFSR